MNEEHEKSLRDITENKNEIQAEIESLNEEKEKIMDVSTRRKEILIGLKLKILS